MTTPNNTVAGLVEKVREIITLLRQPEPDNGEKYTEFDEGYDQASSEIADMLERALASPAPSAGVGVEPVLRLQIVDGIVKREWAANSESGLKALPAGTHFLYPSAPSAPPSVAGDAGEVAEVLRLLETPEVHHYQSSEDGEPYETVAITEPLHPLHTRAASLIRRLATAEQPSVLESEVLDFITMVPGDRCHRMLVERGWLPPGSEQPGSAVQGKAVAWVAVYADGSTYGNPIMGTPTPYMVEWNAQQNHPLRPLIFGDAPPAPAAEQGQPEARGVEGILGRLPAPIQNPEAWPPNYASGWNDCASIALDEMTAALAGKEGA